MNIVKLGAELSITYQDLVKIYGLSSFGPFFNFARQQEITALKMAPSLRIAGIALVSLSISAGVYGLFGLGFAGGLMKILQAVIGDSNSSWPGTTSPFRRTFTGVSPIDAWLTNLNPFFAHLADGSDANLSLFWLFMFGQYGVAWALVLMESLRVGNAGKIVS